MEVLENNVNALAMEHTQVHAVHVQKVVRGDNKRDREVDY